jgi:O-antigen/teichoic acid export membrane protein
VSSRQNSTVPRLRLPHEVVRLMISGSTWSLAFQGSSKIVLLAVTFISARLLGVHEFGLLASLQGIAIVSGSLLDFGTSMFVQRELAAGRLTNSSWRTAIRIRLWLIPVAAILASACLVLGRGQLGLALGCMVAASLAMNVSALTNGALLGQLRFRSSALTQSAGRFVFLLVLLAEWAVHLASLAGIAAAFAMGEISIAVLQSSLVRGRVHGALQSSSGKNVSITAALPYWLNSVFNLIYNRADAAIVALFAGATQAGLYAPASSIQSALIVIPGLATASLPNVGAHTFSSHGLRTLNRMLRVTMGASVLLGTLAAIAATILAPAMLRLMAGGAFAGAVVPTQILAWSLPFYGAELALLGYLVALGRPSATTWGYATALVTALVGLAALSPRYGAVGAALGSLAREPVTVGVLGILALRANQHTKPAVGDPSQLFSRRVGK